MARKIPAFIIMAALILALNPSSRARCQGGCMPGTIPPPGPYRAYLPLVVGGTPQVACAEEQEVNDTHTDAVPFTVHCFWGTAEWDGDADWYRVNLCSGPFELSAGLDVDGAGSNLDLYLYGDPPGWPIASSESSGPDESLSARLVTGTYYILVHPAWGTPAYYTLTAEVRR